MRTPLKNDIYIHKEIHELKITVLGKVELPKMGIRLLANDTIKNRWNVWACEYDRGGIVYKTMRELTSQFNYTGKKFKTKLSRLDTIEEEDNETQV